MKININMMSEHAYSYGICHSFFISSKYSSNFID